MKTSALFILLIFNHVIPHYSKYDIPSKIEQFCDGNSYYCPSSNLCHNKLMRCTLLEKCNYTGYESNNCFRSEIYHGAYEVLLGHHKMYPRLPLPAPLQPEHQFIQYRGLTYQNNVILDVNDPMYHYGENNLDWTYAGKGLENVGISYCDFSDIKYYFLAYWNLMPYHILKRNCIHFSEALQLFLTTGPCQEPINMDVKYDHLQTISKHGRDVVRRVPNTCKIYGRRQWSYFVVQSVNTRIIVTTFLVQCSVLYMLQ